MAVQYRPYDVPEACYAEAIFDRGTFSLRTLQHSLGYLVDPAKHKKMTAAELRTVALQVLSKESAAKQKGGTQREHAIQTWQRFFGDCIKSWHKERAPRGLFVDNGVPFIVTQAGLEQVRMCLPTRLETLALPGSTIPAELDGVGLDSANQVPNRDFRHLLEAVALVRGAARQHLPNGFVEAPLQQTRKEVDLLLEESLDVIDAVGAKLNAIWNLPRAANRLLTLIDAKDEGERQVHLSTVQQLFRGRTGNQTLVSELVHQINDRVLVLRGLLQVMDIASRHPAQFNISGSDIAKIAAGIRPKTANLLRSFSTLLWVSRQPSSSAGSTLASTLLSEFVGNYQTRVAFHFDEADSAHSLAQCSQFAMEDWSYLQSGLVAALLDEMRTPMKIPLFLLETEQFEKIKEYAALEGSGGYKGPIAYVLGRAYLKGNDFQKAKSAFLAAGATLGAGDETSDEQMKAFFYGASVADEKPLTRVAFFTKVASLFESEIPHRLTGGRHETLQMFSAPQMVIHFAREAINGLDSATRGAMDVDEAQHLARDELQRLRSMLIKHLLLLGHHDAAMTFVVSLPRRESADADAQKKFLHLVIKQLCEREWETFVPQSAFGCNGATQKQLLVKMMMPVYGSEMRPKLMTSLHIKVWISKPLLKTRLQRVGWNQRL